MQDQLQAVLSARMVEPNRISISIGQDTAGQADSPGVARKAMRERLVKTEEHSEPELSVPERPGWVPWRGRAARATAIPILAMQSQSAVTATSEPVAAEYITTNTLIFGLDEEDSSPVEAAGDQGAVRHGPKPYPNEQTPNLPDGGIKKSLQHVMHVSAACTAAVVGVPQQESRAVDNHPMMDQCIKSDSETLVIGAVVPSTPDTGPQEEPTIPHTALGSTSSVVTDVGEGSNPEGLAASEPAADGDLTADKETQLAACKALADVTANLEALRRRIAAEQLRALVEGAPFLVHAAPGRKLQIVWYKYGSTTAILIEGSGFRGFRVLISYTLVCTN